MEQNRMNSMIKRIGIYLVVICIAFACKNNTENEEKAPSLEFENVEPIVCINEVSFGDTKFCLPEINGIKECYSHPKVKIRADEIEDLDNTTLGYYLNDETYSKVEDIENINYDDYYKVYAPNVGMGYNMTVSEMNQVMSMMSAGFIEKTLEETNEDIKRSGKGVQLSQPTLIGKFAVNDRSSTLLVLMRVTGVNVDKVMALSMSSILSKNRLIFVAHYLDYQDEKTIAKLKENTSDFIDAFQEANI
jgi:hypothetical protein